MHKNEPRVNPTLINYVIMVYELGVGTIGTYRSIGYLIIQFWSWFDILVKRINCISIPYVNNNKMTLGSMIYYPLHTDSLWTGICDLTRECYHLSRLPFKSLSYKYHLLFDQLIYSNFKEYMSSSTKGIIVVINFMITCCLNHPMEHTVSISGDIMVPLLRITVVNNLYQQ